MQLGAKGKALIQSFEQCRLTAYRDGGGVLTIGWGHTGPDVKEGLVWTQEEADLWLDIDAHEALQAVNSAGLGQLTQNEFDALVCFTFNVGVVAATQSTLFRLLRAGRLGSAAAEFVKWDHDNGKEIAGLKRRREAERELFLAPA